MCCYSSQKEKIVYAASTKDQGIEAYWSRLKKFHLSWWIDFFSKMVYNGMFQANLETLQKMFVVLLLAHNTKGTERIYKSLEFAFCKTVS